MKIASSLLSIGALFASCEAFHTSDTKPKGHFVTSSTATKIHEDATFSRQRALHQLIGIVSSLVVAPTISNADVYAGDSLPQGAAQFSRVVRLQSDIRKVKKRVAEAGSEIDKKEWDNIGQFLRTAYSVGDDMKAVASGISNPDNKKKALEDIELLRKYAQAADVSVSRQEASGFVTVADKMAGLVDDFFECLSDIPDEI